MLSRLNRNWFFDGIDAREIHCNFPDARQSLVDTICSEMRQVKVHVSIFDASSSVYFILDRSSHDVSRGEILGSGRHAFHEPLTLAVIEYATLTPRALGHQDVGAIERRGVELNELGIF